MAKPNYISLLIGGKRADIDPEGQVPLVSYTLEDDQDFEKKGSAIAANVEMPATLINDQIHNTLRDPSVRDSTEDQSYDNFQDAIYLANGQEILVGKYLPQSATILNGKPHRYNGKLYGLNGDWVIALKEKTLLDFVNSEPHDFSVSVIEGSWSFDGRSEHQDYVYAPVRYLKPFGQAPEPTEEDPDPQPQDLNCIPTDLKPSISVYWLLYRGFRSAGYRLVSRFMDSDYYRRGVLPWVWGGFDYMDDIRWEPLKFLSSGPQRRFTGSRNAFVDMQIKDDGSIAGTFDNSNLHSYTGAGSSLPYMMKFDYPAAGSPLTLGKVKANFSVQLSYDYNVRENSQITTRVFWYVNGIEKASTIVFDAHAGIGFGDRRQGSDFKEIFFETDLFPGDWVGARVNLYMFDTLLGTAQLNIAVEAFQLNYLRLTEGSVINLKNYSAFSNYKWLDLLRGEIDLFDLQINTDPVRREVYIEPAHAYEINGDDYEGYYNRKQLDWSQKIDQSKENTLELFSDYERELDFTFKEDNADGGVKILEQRNGTTIGKAKYVLPERFKTEKKDKENRFYSAVVHYEHDKWKSITGVAPQLIALIPENISDASRREGETLFAPKRAWYKGRVTGVGGWRFNGVSLPTIPYMFAVNYKPGGENDPVLSYSDQLIAGKIASGLLKKFFLQRMAIIRNGRRFNPVWVMLNNTDISNFLRRESVIIEGLEYIITQISDYDPIKVRSTAVKMWMFSAITHRDRDAVYPSLASIQSGTSTGAYEVKYCQQLLLTTDVNP